MPLTRQEIEACIAACEAHGPEWNLLPGKDANFPVRTVYLMRDHGWRDGSALRDITEALDLPPWQLGHITPSETRARFEALLEKTEP